MASVPNTSQFSAQLQEIMFDPLRYIHAERLLLPSPLKVPRARAVMNRILLGSIPPSPLSIDITASWHSCARHMQLLKQWSRLPYICKLVGAQRSRECLAWGGRNLKLSPVVRNFMALPLWQADDDDCFGSDKMRFSSTSEMEGIELSSELQLQAAGLACLLNWQIAAPSTLISRMQLMFHPELDKLFASRRRQPTYPELILILQAIEYAKNYPDDV
ncbi:type III secretion system OrgA/MxiK family protein [Herbaspirillum sp. Sphag1AN]|uniref:hypothetical protein n=1 Tax=unclassified Herbaspirillum TaxID=2624150 RepID=UPI0016169205|nr:MULTISPECIES: hypothetical protein [unclassified Herbaspirillum]MBB3211543.1 type III secretion system OrgA/MxiK family protein [Herbaspirillum sp. Sphag1AN]MBB3245190.1 type III secretion system OrgA/MxiK family protein [Herbaspirillum sp. Sphag64]